MFTGRHGTGINAVYLFTLLLTACGQGQTIVDPAPVHTINMSAPSNTIKWVYFRGHSQANWQFLPESVDVNSQSRWTLSTTSSTQHTLVYARVYSSGERIHVMGLPSHLFTDITITRHGISGGTNLNGTTIFNSGADSGHIVSEEAVAMPAPTPVSPAFTIETIEPVQDVLAIEFSTRNSDIIPNRLVILRNYDFSLQPMLNIDFTAGIPPRTLAASIQTPASGDYRTAGFRTAGGVDITGLFDTATGQIYLPSSGTLPDDLFYLYASSSDRGATYFYHVNDTANPAINLTDLPALATPSFDTGKFTGLTYFTPPDHPQLVGWNIIIRQQETAWDMVFSREFVSESGELAIPDLNGIPDMPQEKKLVPGVTAKATIIALLADTAFALADSNPLTSGSYRQEQVWKVIEFTP